MKDNITNPVLDAIEQRVSVRKFTGEPVTGEQVRILLNAAFCAPSACNRRPWEFVVVRDREILGEFARRFRFQKMMAEAELAIVVCGDTERAVERELMINDCSAAVQNILLAAHSIGLGTCWCGLRPDGFARRTAGYLGLPEHIIPIAAVAVGHPGESRRQKDRFEPERVHYDRWENR